MIFTNPEPETPTLLDNPLTDKVCSEITVTVKDSEKTLREKFLIYSAYTVHHDDPVIGSCVAKTIKSFNGEPDSVKIRINMEL